MPTTPPSTGGREFTDLSVGFWEPQAGAMGFDLWFHILASCCDAFFDNRETSLPGAALFADVAHQPTQQAPRHQHDYFPFYSTGI